MNPKERLLKVLRGEIADRIPVIEPGGMMNPVSCELMKKINLDFKNSHNSAEDMAKIAISVARENIFENCAVPFDMTMEAEALGSIVDYGSDVFEPHVKEYALNSLNEVYKLPKLDISRGRIAEVIKAIEILKDKEAEYPIIGNLTGPISVASSVLDPVVYYRDLRKNNEAVHLFTEKITRDLIAIGEKMVEAGADIIAISDPSATGEILGKKYFREFAIKYLNMLLDSLPEDIPTIVHICGKMQNVLEDCNDIHSNALSFDSKVPVSLQRKTLTHHVLMGNISTYALEFGDVSGIHSLTENAIKSGINILSPACGIGMRSPVANLSQILKTAKELAN